MFFVKIVKKSEDGRPKSEDWKNYKKVKSCLLFIVQVERGKWKEEKAADLLLKNSKDYFLRKSAILIVFGSGR
jgi:hypothetical protein